MKKTYLIIITIITVILTATCASAPPPERLTSDDCLVVIKTALVNPDLLSIARTYKFTISGFEQPFVVSDKSEDYIAVKIRKDNFRITSLSSDLKQGYKGKSSNDDLNILLPYIPDSIVLADFAFIMNYKKISQQETVSSIDFVEVSEADKSALLKELKESGEYDSWWD